MHGILLIALCIAFVFVIIFAYKNLNGCIAIGFIFVFGLFLRIESSTHKHLNDWDERYHALVAKNLIDEPFKPMLIKNPVLPYNYRNWDNNHIWLHKQPLPLWIMALSLKVFGIHAFVLRLPSVIMSSLIILVIFHLGKIIFNQKIGLIAAFLFAINGFIIEITAGKIPTDHIDVMFLFFTTCSIYCCILYMTKLKFYFVIWCGILLGCAILTKWLPALIVLPIWVCASIYYKHSFTKVLKNTITILLLATVIVVPWQWYITSSFPLESAWEYAYNRRHIFEVLGQDRGNFFYNSKWLRINFGDLIYLPLLALVVFSFTKRKNPLFFKYSILSLWIFVPLLFFSIIKTKMPGYILFTAPALFITTAFFWQFLLYKYKNHKFIQTLAIIAIFILPLRYMIERIKPFQSESKLSISTLYNAKTIVFNDPDNIQTMFFTNCHVAYQFTPDKNILDSLQNIGFEIVVK